MVSGLDGDRRAARRTRSPPSTKNIECLPCVTAPARIEPPRGQRRHARRCACESEMRAGSARGTQTWATWLRLRWQSYPGAAAPAAPLGRVVRIVRSAKKMASSSLHRDLLATPRPAIAFKFGTGCRAPSVPERARRELSGAMRATSGAQRTAERQRPTLGRCDPPCLTVNDLRTSMITGSTAAIGSVSKSSQFGLVGLEA